MMALLADGRDLWQRFGIYIDGFRQLFQENHIEGEDWYAHFKLSLGDPEFRNKWNSIWNAILEQEGGKLSLTAIFGVLGAALGSIGIAGFGSAIGLPLVLLAIPAGILGNEIDTEGVTKSAIRKVRKLFSTSQLGDSQDDGTDFTIEEFCHPSTNGRANK
jgi:hypothetical protein